MDKHALNIEITKLAHEIDLLYQDLDYRSATKKAQKIEALIENYLSKYSHDTEMWLKLALLEYLPPLADYIKAIEYIKKVLFYNSQNTYAAVLLTVMLNNSTIVNKECFNILGTIKTNDHEFQAMIEFAKSLCYDDQNNSKKSLEHYNSALFFWQEHVRELLSIYSYADYDKISDERTRANLQSIYRYPKEPYNPLSIEQFINEYIRSKIAGMSID